MYVRICQLPTEATKGCQILWNWNDRWMVLVATWMLRIEPESSGRVAGALNLNHLSSSLYTGFNFNNESVYKIE